MEKQSESEQQKEQSLDPHDTVDNFLQTLVLLADAGIEIGVTLTVSGFLVSGIIVGGKRYFEEHLVSNLVNNMPEDTRETMRAYFKRFGKVYDPLQEDSNEEESVTTFIHLREARFFHPAGNPTPNNRTVWWRGRLSEIGGFCIGTISKDAVTSGF